MIREEAMFFRRLSPTDMLEDDRESELMKRTDIHNGIVTSLDSVCDMDFVLVER